MANIKNNTNSENIIEIFDTTLRDGSQSSDVNLSVYDKLDIVRMLDDFGVMYIELGWPGSNPKDIQCFKEVQSLRLKNSRIVAFGSTRRIGISSYDDSNLRAIIESKTGVACIFGKTWVEHVKKQLKATPQQNLDSIRDSIEFLFRNGLEVIYDLEHFFDGFKDNKDYALECIKTACNAGVSTLVMCDTNGGTLTFEILEIVNAVQGFLKENKLLVRLGIHTHNDSGLAVANAIEAVKLGVTHVQGTINGIGERTGNADLCQIIPILKLKLGQNLGKIDVKKLTKLSRQVYTLTNLKPYDRQPYVGKNAFLHKGGVHVDAVMKGASYEHINPEEVGNSRDIVLSDLSGRATIVEVAKKFGYIVNKNDANVRAMLEKVESMEKAGYDIGTIRAEQYLLVEEFFGNRKLPFDVDGWEIISEHKNKDSTTCKIFGTLKGDKLTETDSVIGGPVDTSYKALQKLISKEYKEIYTVKLANYKVMMAEEKGAESTVRVYIEFNDGREEWACVGVNANIITASLTAIEKGFRYYLLKHTNSDTKKT